MRYLHPDKQTALNSVLVKEAKRRVASKPRAPGAAQAGGLVQRIAERLDAAKRGL